MQISIKYFIVICFIIFAAIFSLGWYANNRRNYAISAKADLERLSADNKQLKDKESKLDDINKRLTAEINISKQRIDELTKQTQQLSGQLSTNNTEQGQTIRELEQTNIKFEQLLKRIGVGENSI